MVTTRHNCLNKNNNNNKINESRYSNFFCYVVALTHNTFTQLDIPTQDLPSQLI